METRILEVSTEGCHLSKARGFLVVSNRGDSGEPLGQLPLDDVAAVIANAHGLSYSNNILVALAERGVPFVLCAANHNVVGMVFPVGAHHLQAKRYDAQAACKTTTRKRLWQQIVRAKLKNQARVVDFFGGRSAAINRLARQTRSGDPSNTEAQGARIYWQALFGREFRRDRSEGGINAHLNYGYTVFRAAVARSVVAAGLHPTLGLHHANSSNPMRLVDDLIEPYRPLVDYTVLKVGSVMQNDVTRESKSELVGLLYRDWETPQGKTP
ncbi:MAG: type II CRISPR-associated endonuclease Cas1, partial [Pseudomonadota bacterium]